ncbi:MULTISPECIES: LytR C-terminal domain-containing protein [Streptomyces]|uniref:LytR C-terminal domain-containing protein n=2 Tax=Streptomyces TaxID=1883 RepID=A0A927BJV6_STRGL|nr:MULTISPECIES: LytR C-terminal domain-containing protein [Streptomyces]MBD2828534.1 LytR C-terminal domain-containing protein [Streptomyces globisporus]MYW80985.1 LytR family transcriptional regulator [Streptomyces sp. SID8369]NEA08979.1 LytR C-terminal domain-containing protein [Streptomyces sp. SID10692]NEC41225.1 LytR C-terminal domain-containing protein [Streptomyces sp. SID8016]KOG78840.1 membrane protein [Streptomyces griseus subsp. rhodochrous]
MGGKYRITGDAYPRMRRPRKRRRLVLAGVGAVVALGLAGWGTLQLIDVFTGGDKSAAAAGHKRACPTVKPAVAPAKALPKPAAVKVNVYNATTRSGLAKDAAEELKKRGFAIGEVGNASKEYDKKVPGTGVLLGAPAAKNGGFTVLGTQLAGAVEKTDARKTGEIDLILGTKFKAFSTPQEATAAMTALTKPAPAPSPSC